MTDPNSKKASFDASVEALERALAPNHLRRKAANFIAQLLVIETEAGQTETYRQAFSNPNSLSAIPSKTQMPSHYAVTWMRSSESALNLVKNLQTQGQPICVVFLEDVELMKNLLLEDPLLIAVLLTQNETCDFDFVQTYLGEDYTGRWDYIHKNANAEQLQHRMILAVANWKMRSEIQNQKTELAHLQEKMVETDKLASIATVARGVGHEFGNILTQVLAKAEISKLKPEAEVRDNLDGIVKAALRARDVLERFRFLSGSTDQAPASQWMFLQEPLNEALDLMNYQLLEQHVTVCFVKTKKIPIYGNATALMQVFLNLLINAVSAMGANGQIDVTIDEVAATGTEGRGWGEIRVRDYGPGVDQNLLPQVSTPYFTTKGSKGTGLGLSIVREIIEKEHGGNLIFRNHETKGFEVIIQLPLEPGVGTAAGATDSLEVAKLMQMIPEKMRS